MAAVEWGQSATFLVVFVLFVVVLCLVAIDWGSSGKQGGRGSRSRRGPRGRQGATGPSGAAGGAGSTGSTGAAGATGGAAFADALLATNTGAQTLPNNGGSTVAFLATPINDGWTPAPNNNFTPPVAGLYLVITTIQLQRTADSGAPTALDVFIASTATVQGGTAKYNSGSLPVTVNSIVTLTTESLIQMGATDELAVVAENTDTSGGAWTIPNVSSTLVAHFLHP